MCVVDNTGMREGERDIHPISHCVLMKRTCGKP
jgi:hypothetical protein